MPLEEIKVLRQKAQLTSNEKGVVAYEDQSSKARGAPPRQKRRARQTQAQNQADLEREEARRQLRREAATTQLMIKQIQKILQDESLKDILNHNDPIEGTIRKKLQSLLQRLITHLTSLESQNLRGGSRKRRHGKRRKTRRNKKKRKKKTIKRRRKRGRKTRKK